MKCLSKTVFIADMEDEWDRDDDDCNESLRLEIIS